MDRLEIRHWVDGVLVERPVVIDTLQTVHRRAARQRDATGIGRDGGVGLEYLDGLLELDGDLGIVPLPSKCDVRRGVGGIDLDRLAVDRDRSRIGPAGNPQAEVEGGGFRGVDVDRDSAVPRQIRVLGYGDLGPRDRQRGPPADILVDGQSVGLDDCVEYRAARVVLMEVEHLIGRGRPGVVLVGLDQALQDVDRLGDVRHRDDIGPLVEVVEDPGCGDGVPDRVLLFEAVSIGLLGVPDAPLVDDNADV